MCSSLCSDLSKYSENSLLETSSNIYLFAASGLDGLGRPCKEKNLNLALNKGLTADEEDIEVLGKRIEAWDESADALDEAVHAADEAIVI